MKNFPKVTGMAGAMVRVVVHKSKRQGLNSSNFLKTMILMVGALLE